MGLVDLVFLAVDKGTASLWWSGSDGFVGGTDSDSLRASRLCSDSVSECLILSQYLERPSMC